MDEPFVPVGESPGFQEASPSRDQQALMEALLVTTAHLAAQLTMTQIRLRAVATVISSDDGVDSDAIAQEVRTIAARDTGVYLRENLGEFLTEMIEVEALERELQGFLEEQDLV